MLKRAVLSARSDGFRLKKRRLLKLIRVFVGNKYIYHSDYQRLSFNAENKRFSSTNDNVPANIGCMYAYNSLFVNIIRMYRRGLPVVLCNVYPKLRYT